ncbi:MAG: tryptophan synthase subunit alpha [Chloroflexi bacterium]|nr:tryptophan synthase subunit alpha [Chloroflexota bacterium]
MNRIDASFQSAKAESRLVLAPYVTVGYPTRESAVELALAYVEAGADMLEIGMPFSDPIADGPTVQLASQIALEGGVWLEDAFHLVERIRSHTDIPLALMGYANPFMQFGLGALARESSAAGADGLIVPDVLPEHAHDIESANARHGLHVIRFAAPTTPLARLRQIGQGARGFIYCVSVTGVTGSRAQLSESLPAYLARVGKATTIPRVVGFGISKPEHLRSLHGRAEGAIVASALIDIVQASPPGRGIEAAAAHVRSLAAAA